eukprot:m.12814 g.12814  ORF g.12814 m.12814 type:complete len:296 (+) comp9461_c0_seq1:468-1355(+)
MYGMMNFKFQPRRIPWIVAILGVVAFGMDILFLLESDKRHCCSYGFQWPGNYTAAVAWTWDDNNYRAFERLLAVAREISPEAKMSFAVIPGYAYYDANRTRKLCDQGGHLSGHTWAHDDLDLITDDDMVNTLSRSQDALQIDVNDDSAAKTLTYPFGSVPDESTHPRGWNAMRHRYISARTVTQGVNYKSARGQYCWLGWFGCRTQMRPHDRYRVKVVDLGISDFDQISTAIHKARADGGYLIFYGHALTGFEGWGPTPETTVNKTLHLLANTADIWQTDYHTIAEHLVTTSQTA